MALSLSDCLGPNTGTSILVRVAKLLGLSIYVIYWFQHTFSRWRSGAVVRASDFGPRGPWFEPRPVHISLWP